MRETLLRRDSPGLAAAAGLHLAAAILFIWWHLHQPPAPAQPLPPALAVDLVSQPAPVNTPRSGGNIARPLVPRAAPRPVGETPKSATPLPDALEARIQGLASLTAPPTALPAPDNDGSGTGSGSGGGYAL